MGERVRLEDETGNGVQYMCSPPKSRSLARSSDVISSSWCHIIQTVPASNAVRFLSPNSKASRTESHLCISCLHPGLVRSNTSVILFGVDALAAAGAIMAIT